MTKDEILKEYTTLKNKIGKVPTRKDMQDIGISKRKISKAFGSFTALKKANNDSNKIFASEKRSCICCGTSFVTKCDNPTQKFCSRACSNKVLKTVHGKYVSNKTCTTCGTSHSRSSEYCSVPCRMIAGMQLKTIKDTIKRKGGANAYDTIRQNARAFSKYFYKKECAICGYDKHYEVCHIKDIKDFDESTPVSEVNAISNLIHLCPNHHWEFDNGKLDLTL